MAAFGAKGLLDTAGGMVTRRAAHKRTRPIPRATHLGAITPKLLGKVGKEDPGLPVSAFEQSNRRGGNRLPDSFR
jgi:hypothetical protein